MKFQQFFRLFLPTFSVLSFFLLLVSCEKTTTNTDDQESIPALENIENQAQTRTADHFGDEIGTVENGEATITADINAIKSSWSNSIATGLGYMPSFDVVTIEQDASGYILLAIDETNNAKSAVGLVLDNGTFYEQSLSGNGNSITCSGCTTTGPDSKDDCRPMDLDTTSPYCSACPAGHGECKKSITVGKGLAAQIINLNE